MQEDTGSGRAFFIQGSGGIAPSSVASQVVSTGVAQVNQVERQKRQKMEDLQTIRDSALQIMKTGQEEQEKANQRNLLSASTTIDKLKIDYQNQVAEGGLIDRQNIPFNEKLRLKQEALDKLTSGLNETKTYLESNKGVLQSILGTEQAYTRSLDIIQNQTQQALNEAQNNIIAEAQRMEKTTTIENLKNISSSITNANTEKQANNIATLSVQRINEAEKQGIITPAEATVLRNNLSNSFNNRAVDIRLNNAWDKVARGDIEGARKDIEIAYDLTRKGKAFNTSFSEDGSYVADQVGNETKLRNFLLELDRMETTRKVEIVLDDIDHSRPSNQNIDFIKEKTKNLPIEVQNKALEKFAKDQKTYNKNPSDLLFQKNPNATISQAQNWLIAQGLGDKSAIATNSQLANGMKSDFSNLGNITTADDKTPKSRDQFELMYEGYLGKFTAPPPEDKEETGIEANERQKRGQELFAKEVKIHGEGIDYMLIQARNNNDEDFLNELINIRVAKNSPKGLPIDKKFKEEDFISSSHKGLQYLKNQDPALYEKMKNGILEVANYTGQSVNDVVDKIYKNNDFITNGNINVKIDKTQYNKSDINSRITIAKRNALQIFGDKKNIIGKYDLAENLFVESNEDGSLNFTLIDQKGNVDYLGTLSIDDLPSPTYINPVENYNPNKPKESLSNVLSEGLKSILSTPFVYK